MNANGKAPHSLACKVVKFACPRKAHGIISPSGTETRVGGKKLTGHIPGKWILD